MGDGVKSHKDYIKLKAAARRLIKLNGGTEASASIARTGRSNMSDYGNVNRLDVWMPVDVAADLEEELGEPVVTKVLCELAGGVFIKIGQFASQSALGVKLAKLGKETSEVFAKMAEALADGNIDKVEAEQTINEINEAIEALVSLRSSLQEEVDNG